MPPIEKFIHTHGTSFRPADGGALGDADRNLQFGVTIHNADTRVTLHATSFTGFSLCTTLDALDARRLGQALLEAAATLEVPA